MSCLADMPFIVMKKSHNVIPDHDTKQLSIPLPTFWPGEASTQRRRLDSIGIPIKDIRRS